MGSQLFIGVGLMLNGLLAKQRNDEIPKQDKRAFVVDLCQGMTGQEESHPHKTLVCFALFS